MRPQAIAFLSLIIFSALLPVYCAEVEPGTSFMTAGELKPGSYSFHLSEGEFHFFKVRLERGQSLYAVLRPPAGQDFDMLLLSPERDLIEQSVRAAGASERVSTQAPYSGDYYLIIYSYGESSGLYTLRIDILETPTETITKWVTVTETEHELLREPTAIYYTVTETVEVTVTETSREPLERIPWNFLGLVAIGAALLPGWRRSRRPSGSLDLLPSHHRVSYSPNPLYPDLYHVSW